MNVMRLFGTLLYFIAYYPVYAAPAPSLPVPHGQGAFIYDNTTVGQWADDINSFNTNNLGFPPKYPSGGAVLYPINRLYVDVGDITATCSSSTACNVTVGYASASTAYYYTNVPSPPAKKIFALIGAQRVDPNTGARNPIFDNPAAADLAAYYIVRDVCGDSSVDGVVLDIEPFATDAFNIGSAINTLYNQTAQGLLACNKSMGIFMNPGTVFTSGTWGSVMATIGTNSFLIVGAYDIKDGCINPNENTQSAPWPYAGFSIPSGLYQSSISGKMQYMAIASQQYSIPFTVAIPAAASFSEFAEYNVQGYTPQYTPFYTCPITPPQNQPCTSATDPSRIHQLDYVQTARGVISSTNPIFPTPNVGPLFLGVDYWAWTEPLNPQCAFAPGNDVLLPNTPPGTDDDQVIGYLQNIPFAQQSG